MLCTQCDKNEAEVFFKQIVGNQVTQYVLCRGCAQDKGLAILPKDPFGIMAGLGAMLKRSAARPQTALKCGACGIRWGQFMETGRLGCPGCYAAFRAPLEDLLKRIHGSTRHMGRHPGSAETSSKTVSSSTATKQSATPGELERLRKSLKTAITREDFEEAARLRDRLRKLEDA